MRDFRKYRVWNESKDLVKNIYKLTALFPSNIAEGCSRSSEKDFKRFLEIAQGSAFELETQVIIGFEIGLIEETIQNKAIENLHSIQKSLNALINKLKVC